MVTIYLSPGRRISFDTTDGDGVTTEQFVQSHGWQVCEHAEWLLEPAVAEHLAKAQAMLKAAQEF